MWQPGAATERLVLQQGKIRTSPRREDTMGEGVLRKQAWRMGLRENGR